MVALIHWGWNVLLSRKEEQLMEYKPKASHRSLSSAHTSYMLWTFFTSGVSRPSKALRVKSLWRLLVLLSCLPPANSRISSASWRKEMTLELFTGNEKHNPHGTLLISSSNRDNVISAHWLFLLIQGIICPLLGASLLDHQPTVSFPVSQPMHILPATHGQSNHPISKLLCWSQQTLTGDNWKKVLGEIHESSLNVVGRHWFFHEVKMDQNLRHNKHNRATLNLAMPILTWLLF